MICPFYDKSLRPFPCSCTDITNTQQTEDHASFEEGLASNYARELHLFNMKQVHQQ